MRVQLYSQRKEDASCAGFIQPPERVYCIPPPSNPRLDGRRIYTDFAKYACFFHRPALGWTVTDNTFPALKTCRKHRRSLLFLLANWFPLYTASKLPSAERIWRFFLELVAAITRVFIIMGEEVLEAVIDESDVLAPICEMCRCKTVSQGLPTVELELFQYSLPPGSVSTHSGQCGAPTIAARCISHRSTLRFASQCI